jgi:uncharacterized protein with HEPN domain
MNKTMDILLHILRHIDNILKSKNRYGNDVAIFKSDVDYFNSVCMGLLQIGELANHLPDGFLAAHTEVPWRQIVAMRNVVVHGYGTVNVERIWATVQEDIPELEKKLKDILNEQTQEEAPHA